jgi:CO/xanthine dehydrogenase Mo-binding subunit
MSLPAGPIISLTAALEGVYTLRTGVRFRDLPFTSDRIYRRIFERHAI